MPDVRSRRPAASSRRRLRSRVGGARLARAAADDSWSSSQSVAKAWNREPTRGGAKRFCGLICIWGADTASSADLEIPSTTRSARAKRGLRALLNERDDGADGGGGATLAIVSVSTATDGAPRPNAVTTAVHAGSGGENVEKRVKRPRRCRDGARARARAPSQRADAAPLVCVRAADERPQREAAAAGGRRTPGRVAAAQRLVARGGGGGGGCAAAAHTGRRQPRRRRSARCCL